MFSSELLNEMLGYEKWVLKEAVLAIERFHGVETDSTFVFHEDGLKTHKLQMYEELGSEKRMEVLEKLSPLLFVTSYKVVDMIFEWVLKDNCKEVPWKFAEKINLYEKLNNQSKLVCPPLLSKEKDLKDNLFKLYKNLSTYRNKIIHGNWGTIDNGDLSFNFIHNGKEFNDSFSFKVIMNFAETTSLIAEILTQEPSDSSEIIITVKHLMDSLQDMHKGSLFNVSKPRHFKIHYEVYNRQIVDLKEVRQYLTEQSYNHPFTFKLVLLSKKKRWEFPWKYVKDIDSIDLEDNLDNYLT